MNVKDFIREATLGGPGLDGFVYCADVYCADCAEDIVRDIARTVAPTLSGIDGCMFSDSETVPQPIFFGESDFPEHCASCGAYLYGPEEEEDEIEDETEEEE